ncbi:MAG: DUF2244 domain-containing protein [Pseudorhodoplanes sp.]
MAFCDDADPTLFSAVLTPYRSLGPRGFRALMILVAGLSLVGGTVFYLLGAWPVVGFLGLDVLLVYWAFRLNYRAAGAYEEVTVTPSELRVRQVSAKGAVVEWALNPLWVRLDRETIEEFGLTRLFLISRGRKFPIATCLGPWERESFAARLSAAIAEAKRGPTRTVLS